MADSATKPVQDRWVVQDSTEVTSRGRIPSKLLCGRLGVAADVPPLTLFQTEGTSLKHRLASLLQAMMMLYHCIRGQRDEATDESEKGRTQSDKSTKAVPKGEEVEFLCQQLVETSRQFTDRQSFTEQLEFSSKRKDQSVQELKQMLEAVEVDTEFERNEEMKQKFLLEKKVSKELSQHVDEVSGENRELSQRMEFTKQTQFKSFGLLRAFLRDFMTLCCRLSLVARGGRLQQLLERFESQTDQFWQDINHLILSPVEMAGEKNEAASDAEEEEHKGSGSVFEQKKVNVEIIANLRKIEEINLQLKGHDEELTKERAERESVDTGMRRETTRLRRKAANKKNVWANSSLETAESMRVFVEHIETLVCELFKDKSQKEKETVELSQEMAGSRQTVQQLRCEVDRLGKQAAVEAFSAVEKKIDYLKEENRKLEEVRAKLGERNQKCHEEFEAIVEQRGRMAQEVDRLKSENTKLKLVSQERTRKLEELERKIATHKAQLQGRQFSTPSRSPSQLSFASRDPSRLPGSFPLNDPMTHSLPYRSPSYSAHGREHVSQSGLEKQVSGQNLAEARMMGSQTTSRASQQVVECLKCSSKFPVSKVEDYERHIRQCYGVSLN